MNIEERFNKVRASGTFNRIVSAFNLNNKKVLDLGCGYGEYLACFGPLSQGITTTKDEVSYGNSKGLNIVEGNVEKIDELAIAKDFEAIWANNLFEHLLSPHAFLMNLKKVTKKDAVLILGVPVIPKWHWLVFFNKFRGTLASNHISFFTRESLKLTAERAGWRVIEARGFVSPPWIDRFIKSFIPHIYVVATNDSGFKYPEKKMKEWLGQSHYDKLLDITGQRVI
jgi:SAM-dependent methyltransferase